MPASAEQGSWVPQSDWLDPGRSDGSGAGPGARFILGATLLGGLLRLLLLTRQSLWVDELLTWNAVRPGAGLSFVEQFLDTIQGPLYLAVIWPLLQAQDSELMLRLPAAVAGVLAVPVFGVLAGRWLDRRGARLALLFFALNPFLIWYSQEGRGYSFLVLFAVLTALAYDGMVRRGPAPGRVLAFGLGGAAMVLSNLSGVFLLVAMGMTLLLVDRPVGRRAWGGWILAFGLAALVTAPWLLKASGIWAIDRVVPGAATGEALRGDSTFSWLALPYAVFTFFFGYSLGPSLRELHQPDRMAVVLRAWPVLVAAAGAAGTALLAGLRGLDRSRGRLLVWIAVPVVVLVVLALRNVKPWNPRYVMVVLPWLLVIAGAGLARLPRRGEALVGIVLAGLTAWSLGGYFGADRYAKADLRAAAAHVSRAEPPTRTVLVPVVTSVFAYYDRGAHELRDSYGVAPLRDREAADRYVARVLAGTGRCRVVLARAWYLDPHDLLVPALARAGHVRTEAEFAGVRVLTWERRAESPGDHER